MTEVARGCAVPVESEPAAPGVRGASIDQLMRQIRTGKNGSEGRAAADRLHFALTALATSAPMRQTRDWLQRLLDDKKLDDFVDSWGISCRAAVINAQVALGSPWALEINPADLAWLSQAREERDQRIDADRTAAIALAVVSVVWNGLWALVAQFSEIGALFVVGALHAVATLAAAMLAARASSREEREVFASRYEALGCTGLCGSVFAAIAVAAMISFTGALVGLVAALPTMLVAYACYPAAHSIFPEKLRHPT